MTAVGGVSAYGEKIVGAHPIMLLCLAIPIVMLVFLFGKKYADKKSATIIAICGVIDLIIWIIFKSTVKKVAEENYCSFKKTGWYVLNIISLVLIILLTVLVAIRKLQMNTDLIAFASGGEAKEVLNQVSSKMNQMSNSMGQSTENSQEIKAVPKKLIIGCAVGIVVVILAVCLVRNAGKTIDLNKYLTVEATGYDGYGTAQTSIDWDAIEEKYGDKLKYTSAAKNEYGGLLSMMSPVEIVQEHVSITLDESSELSNGDKVSYTWEIDKDLSKYVKCKVKYKDGSYTVSDLTEVGTFDAFADLDVQFSGIAPSGTAYIDYTGSDLSLYDFSCDKTSGLKNGDSIEITIQNTNMEYYAEKLGKVPEATSKTYTVSGLQEYISAYSDLTEDFLANAQKEAEDSIFAYTASSYNQTSSLNNLEYAGYILNSVKDGSGYVSSYNDLYIIYKGDVSNSEGAFSAAKVYFPVRFSNILKSEDGSLSYSDNTGIEGFSNLDGGWYGTKGYINPLVCYMEIVESNRDEYTAECGDGFEIYSEYENIEKLEDIEESYKETIYSDAKDKIESYIASTYNGGTVAENLVFAGEYLLLAKSQGNDFANNNAYIVVYAATVSNSNGNFETTTVYFPVEYDGIVKLPGDEYMVTATVGIIGNSNFPDSWYYTKGYLDGAEMYSSIITSNRDNYKYEVSEGLREFGE